jgi:hypothetical protein
MSAYEQIMESIAFSREEEIPWWKYFDTRGEAREILREAMQYTPEEYEVINMADSLGTEFPSGQSDIKVVYRKCLRQLRSKLKTK